ncbi:hypothetical protein FE257_003285 [Aspergillus nanangensis]|uniref:MARVEL domain-containing protein n=1 Tax=Aspergillus nanangensis TaxID=2582783 RepID=A0AAD4CSB3_ASPNN|nr:hypothetical protein FE257_003285 [Aspergillus nanangensis]
MNAVPYEVRDGTRAILSLRAIAGFSSLAALAAFGWSQSMHDSDEVVVSDLGHALVSPVVGAVQYTFVWSLIILPVRMSMSGPLHPGIYVTFDLFAWAAILATMIIYLMLMAPYFSGDGYSCGGSYSRSEGCKGKTVADVEKFGTAMAWLAL